MQERIGSTAKSIRFVRWPAGDDYPDGFDTRDWIISGLAAGTPASTYRGLKKLFRHEPRRTQKARRVSGASETESDRGEKDSGNQVQKVMKAASSAKFFRATDGTAFATFGRAGSAKVNAPG